MKDKGQSAIRAHRLPADRPNQGAVRRKQSVVSAGGRITRALWRPVDVASLAFFRIAFGSIMVWEVYRYFAMGRIRRYYLEPQFFFSYFGFDWVKPWPGDGMYFHFAALGLLGIFVAFGLFYRVSAVLFFMGFTYVFLLDQSLYLNHFYLVCLVSLLMIFIPAHRAFSLDARWRIARPSDVAPAWTLWLLRAQIGLVYFFGGIAKLNGDWLRGEPIRDWLAARGSLPVLGPLLGQDWAVWLFAYGGLLFDLLIVPALLWKKTRIAAFVVAVGFHLTNALVFNIGIFPWFMIAATTVFFHPDWPRRWLGQGRAGCPQPVASIINARSHPRRGEDTAPYPRTVATLLVLYLGFQLLVPLRHWFYPGEVSWTEEGHRFSWRMKLRDKFAEAQFYVTDAASGQTEQIDPRQSLNLHQYSEMVTRPDMILQFAHHLAAKARGQGIERVEVRAFVRASVNGRASQLLIDPSVNLAEVPRTLRSANWIRRLDEPLRRASTPDR